MDAGVDVAPAPISVALSRFIGFVESLLVDPARLSPDQTIRLRRFLIRVANDSRPAIRLAVRYEVGEIDGDGLLELMW